jgi:hypothetical protein
MMPCGSPLVEKKWLEIGVSTGLVLLMILLMIAVQLVVPPELRAPAIVLVMLLYIASMGLAGTRLLDV